MIEMRKKILFITIISAFLLLAIPCLPAIEYKICLNENESQDFDKQKNNELSISEKTNKLKNNNLIEILRVIKNIDIDVLKVNILNDVKNSELTVQQKLFVEKLFTSQKFINVFLKGIIIPIILYTFAYHSIKIVPNALGLLSIVVIGWAVPEYFINPVAHDIQENTKIPWIISSLLLAIIDNTIAYLISSTLISI